MNTRLLNSSIMCLTTAAILAGCQTPLKINAEFDSAANFAAAKTFAVLPLPKQIEGVDPGTLLRVGPAAMNAVRAAMQEKGYSEVPQAPMADIAVFVHGKAVPKTDITDWGFAPTYGAYRRGGWYGGYPYGMYGMSNITVDQYQEGTLIVEIYEVQSKKMIWVGWASARATSKTEEQAGRVSAGITQILAEYPAVGEIPVAPARK